MHLHGSVIPDVDYREVKSMQLEDPSLQFLQAAWLGRFDCSHSKGLWSISITKRTPARFLSGVQLAYSMTVPLTVDRTAPKPVSDASVVSTKMVMMVRVIKDGWAN